MDYWIWRPAGAGRYCAEGVESLLHRIQTIICTQTKPVPDPGIMPGRRICFVRRQSGGGGPNQWTGGLIAAGADPGMPHTNLVAHPPRLVIQRTPPQE